MSRVDDSSGAGKKTLNFTFSGLEGLAVDSSGAIVRIAATGAASDRSAIASRASQAVNPGQPMPPPQSAATRLVEIAEDLFIFGCVYEQRGGTASVPGDDGVAVRGGLTGLLSEARAEFGGGVVSGHDEEVMERGDGAARGGVHALVEGVEQVGARGTD